MSRLATFVPKSATPTSDPAAMTVRDVNNLPVGTTVYVAEKMASGICDRVVIVRKFPNGDGVAFFKADGTTIEWPTGRLYTTPEAAKARCRASLTSSITSLQRRLDKLDA